MSRIVDFGYRASNACSCRPEGSGLGLTKAYYFAKEFGGTFQVKVCNIISYAE
jgi:signal transduction histidine kinase